MGINKSTTTLLIKKLAVERHEPCPNHSAGKQLHLVEVPVHYVYLGRYQIGKYPSLLGSVSFCIWG